MKTPTHLLEEALIQYLAGNSRQVYYDRIINYSRQYVLPINDTIQKEDVIIDSLAKFYTYGQEFDSSKSNVITYWLNFLKMNSKAIYVEANRQKRIPNESLQRETIVTDYDDTVNIFDILADTTFDIDSVLISSGDLSEDLRVFVLENNLDVLYAFIYSQVYTPSKNGDRSNEKHVDKNVTYKKLAVQFNESVGQIRNYLYHQKQYCVKHFPKYLYNKYKDEIFI